ncbi:hypothetical protein [Glaciecola sp. 33A]|uniref:PKD domain-containing protein n=1 Tax=Glaciecola sp. 33A TaxID=2057807 RepID=UPI000C33BF5A|nr:hypothetical protein [Glaciecola sp. 33A]PKI02345.1 hypothetical protein CXF81_06695 [Glaciecola sp. 33A]
MLQYKPNDFLKKSLTQSLLILSLAALLPACGGGESNSVPDIPTNIAPIANAGSDIKSQEQEEVTIQGSGTDSDGSISRYTLTQSDGTALTITSANSAVASVDIPVTVSDEVTVFTLTLPDNEGATSTDSITLTYVAGGSNLIPTANAGANQTSVNTSDTVKLNGLGSTDDTGIASYSWRQISGLYAILDNAHIATPTFVAPQITNRSTFAQDLAKTETFSTVTQQVIPRSLSKLFDITYLGAMRVESQNPNEPDGNSNFSSGALGYNAVNDSLYMSGRNGGIAEFKVPINLSLSNDVQTIPAATVLQPYYNVLAANTLNPTAVNTIDGILEFNGNLLVSSEAFYNASATNPSNLQIFDNANSIATANNKGLLELAGAAKAAGYMGEIPVSLQGLLGGTHYAGWASNYSITGRYSQGPSLYVFDPQDAVDADLTVDPKIPSTPIISYPAGPTTELAPNGSDYIIDPDPLWSSGAKAKGAVFIPDTSFFLAIGQQAGLDTGSGYKITQLDTGKLCGGGCSFVSTDIYSYFWLFDVADAVNATNPHGPRPFAFGKWSHPFDDGSDHQPLGSTFDPINNRLFIALNGAGQRGNYDSPPLVIAYQITPKAVEDTTITAEATDMVFELEVTDTEGLSSRDTVTISLNNTGSLTPGTTTPDLYISAAQTTYNLNVGDPLSAPTGT